MNSSVPESQLQVERLLNPLPVEFEAAGLVFKEKVPKKGLFGRTNVSFYFVNPVAKTELKIYVSDKGIVNVSVFREDEKDGYFSLCEYLKCHHRQDESSMLFHRSDDIEFSIAYLRKIVARDWGEILRGERWESIPYDWQEYG